MGQDNPPPAPTRSGTVALSRDHPLGNSESPDTGTRTSHPGQLLMKPGEYRRATTRNLPKLTRRSMSFSEADCTEAPVVISVMQRTLEHCSVDSSLQYGAFVRCSCSKEEGAERAHKRQAYLNGVH